MLPTAEQFVVSLHSLELLFFSSIQVQSREGRYPSEFPMTKRKGRWKWTLAVVLLWMRLFPELAKANLLVVHEDGVAR